MAAGRCNLAGRLGQAVHSACGERNFGPRGSEESGEMSADPARSASHERHLAREVEARQPGHDTISLARSRNSNFWILPVEVFGSGPNTMVRGTL